MSRYTLLLLLNLPFVLAGLLTALTQYKLSRITKRRMLIQILIWFTVLIGLVLAEPTYLWLRGRGLTVTDSLSLFDVVQITALVIVTYVVNRMRLKLAVLERRVLDLHQELSIRLSSKD
jgi:hypothetical protein